MQIILTSFSYSLYHMQHHACFYSFIHVALLLSLQHQGVVHQVAQGVVHQVGQASKVLGIQPLRSGLSRGKQNNFNYNTATKDVIINQVPTTMVGSPDQVGFGRKALSAVGQLVDGPDPADTVGPSRKSEHKQGYKYIFHFDHPPPPLLRFIFSPDK